MTVYECCKKSQGEADGVLPTGLEKELCWGFGSCLSSLALLGFLWIMCQVSMKWVLALGKKNKLQAPFILSVIWWVNSQTCPSLFFCQSYLLHTVHGFLISYQYLKTPADPYGLAITRGWILLLRKKKSFIHFQETHCHCVSWKCL